MIRDGLTGAVNIIVFDNGGIAGYPSNCRLYSRIIEIAPVLKQIVWEYINPFFGVETLNSHTYRQNKVYRVWRVDLDWPQLESR